MLLAAKNMCDILQKDLDDKYIILPCSDLAAAEKLLALEPDILILNLSLPAGNGLTFLKDHAGLLPPAILVITPYLDNSILTEVYNLGVRCVIRIPFRTSYLKMYLADI